MSFFFKLPSCSNYITVWSFALVRMLLCECCLRETKLHDVQKAACFLSVILTPTTVVKSLTACLSTTRTLTWMFLGNLPKVGFIVSSGCV